MRIDLHHHLLHNRRETVRADRIKKGERLQFRLWRAAMMRPWLYSAAGRFGRLGLRVLYGLGLTGTVFDPLRVWNRHRAPVPLPKKSFRVLWKKESRK